MHLAMILAAMLAVTGTSRERELGGRWSWEERHRQLVSKIAENPEATYDIVFIGDGLTELMANVRQGNDAVFAEYFGKYRTFNLGIQGDRLENLVWRLENGALDGYRAKVFRIMAGSNNLPQKWPPAMLAEGVGRLVEPDPRQASRGQNRNRRHPAARRSPHAQGRDGSAASRQYAYRTSGRRR